MGSHVNIKVGGVPETFPTLLTLVGFSSGACLHTYICVANGGGESASTLLPGRQLPSTVGLPTRLTVCWGCEGWAVVAARSLVNTPGHTQVFPILTEHWKALSRVLEQSRDAFCMLTIWTCVPPIWSTQECQKAQALSEDFTISIRVTESHSILASCLLTEISAECFHCQTY